MNDRNVVATTSVQKKKKKKKIHFKHSDIFFFYNKLKFQNVKINCFYNMVVSSNYIIYINVYFN